jgi:hypothetical protein
MQIEKSRGPRGSTVLAMLQLLAIGPYDVGAPERISIIRISCRIAPDLAHDPSIPLCILATSRVGSARQFDSSPIQCDVHHSREASA